MVGLALPKIPLFPLFYPHQAINLRRTCYLSIYDQVLSSHVGDKFRIFNHLCCENIQRDKWQQSLYTKLDLLH